jgi:hypothetical protein
MKLSGNVIIVKKNAKKERDSFLEDRLASTSPEYLKSIKVVRTNKKQNKS